MTQFETESRSSTNGSVLGVFSGARTTIGDHLAEVVLVGTYPPTECGIATHTANLRSAMEAVGIRSSVIRLVEPGVDAGPDRADVRAVWRRGAPQGLVDALAAVDDVDAVVVQHEYGIYAGCDGEEVVDFVARCTKPVVTVLHTVLPEPTTRQRRIIDQLALHSVVLVVHTEAARHRLLATHQLEPAAVVVIPHGASLNLCEPEPAAPTVPVLLTWGLLGPGKGIEHGIEAVALLRERGRAVRYLISGETHPNVRRQQGEQYRDALRALAMRRGVTDLIEFDDRYRDWDSLRALVRGATIVVVPYDSRDQVTSGVLVEALASGKPVVSTRFPHALELEATGAVSVVEHESAGQLADALERILADPILRGNMADAARKEGVRYDWSLVGQRFRSLILEAVGRRNGNESQGTPQR